MSADQLSALLAAVGCAPALPGARCRGRHRLFDEQGKHEAPETAAQRHAQAVGLCTHCPALTACKQWFDSLPTSKRPAGVVAGHSPRPKTVGRPTNTNRKGTNRMTDHPYPPDWDDIPPPDKHDPRYGDALDPWRPTQAQRALTAELAAAYIARDPGFFELFLTYGADRFADKAWPQAFLAILELYTSTAVGAQGEKLSIARAQGDTEAIRGTILESGGTQ